MKEESSPRKLLLEGAPRVTVTHVASIRGIAGSIGILATSLSVPHGRGEGIVRTAAASCATATAGSVARVGVWVVAGGAHGCEREKGVPVLVVAVVVASDVFD